MQTIKQLWQSYIFLSNEMTKFINQNDFEMFENILIQRETVKSKIEACAEQKDFAKTTEFQNIRTEAIAINDQVSEKIKIHKTNLEKQITLVHSYEFFGDKMHIGTRFNGTT